MTLAIRRIKVYLKLVVIIAAGAALLLLVLKNLTKTADIWFFHAYEDVNILWLLLVTAVGAVVCWWGVRKVFKVLRELKEVRQARLAEQRLAEQRRLNLELTDREKRIDEKIRRSITEET